MAGTSDNGASESASRVIRRLAPTTGTAVPTAANTPATQLTSLLVSQPAGLDNASSLTISAASTTLAAPVSISSNPLLSSPTASLVVLAIPTSLAEVVPSAAPSTGQSTGSPIAAPAADVLFGLLPDASDVTSSVAPTADASDSLLDVLATSSTVPALAPAIGVANLAAPASRAGTSSLTGSPLLASPALLDEAHSGAARDCRRPGLALGLRAGQYSGHGLGRCGPHGTFSR